MGPQCPGDCDGRPESHDPNDLAPVYIGDPADLRDGPGDPALWVPGLAMWPGGERGRVCYAWAVRSRFLGHVMQSLRWANAGQSLGPLDVHPPGYTEAIMSARGEWDCMANEEREAR